MNPEIRVCLDLIDEITDDCQDALIASWSEKDLGVRKVMKEIYYEKDKQREKLFKKLNELCQK